jgi:CHAD domain-containing protein
MRDAARQIKLARRGPSERAIHDLRVALRRCRTLARQIERVEPSGPHARIDSLGKRLFRKMNGLRDLQVKRRWAARLFAAHPGAAQRLLKALRKAEKKEMRKIRKALRGFELKTWKKLAVRAAGSPGAGAIPAARLAVMARRLASEIRCLHYHAARTRRKKLYHELRIAIKKYRYFTDAFLPERARAVAGKLRRIQKILGDAHDLDELARTLARLRRKFGGEEYRCLRALVRSEKRGCIGRYHAIMRTGEGIPDEGAGRGGGARA